MKIYLVRHGLTDWNVEGKIQGKNDIELNSEGVLQAEHLALRLSRYKIEKIYSSSLSRARITAKCISNRLKSPYVIDERLNEKSFGNWEGHSFSEVEKLFKKEVEEFYEDMYGYVNPGAENYRVFEKRIFCFLKQVLNEHENDICLVTHGAVIKAIVANILNLPFESRFLFDVANGSLTLIEWSKNYNKLLVLNDVAHTENHLKKNIFTII